MCSAPEDQGPVYSTPFAEHGGPDLYAESSAISHYATLPNADSTNTTAYHRDRPDPASSDALPASYISVQDASGRQYVDTYIGPNVRPASSAALPSSYISVQGASLYSQPAIASQYVDTYVGQNVLYAAGGPADAELDTRASYLTVGE